MFILKKSLFIFNFLFNILTCDGTDYCSSEYCENTKQHTLCKFQSDEPARHCIDFEKTVTNLKVKRAILDKINSRRNQVASGEIRSFPPAANMMKMEWDNELEISAQRWVNQCVQHKIPNIADDCRDLEKVNVGQNIATVFGESPGMSPATLVDVWFMELLNTNASLLFYYQPSINFEYSHYDYFTQLIWATSSNVGCGGAKFKERLKDVETRYRTIYRLVCNFAPGGNHHNKTTYIEGLPCSQCHFGSICNSDYKSLCTKSKDINRHAQKTILDERTENVEATVMYTSDNIENQDTVKYLAVAETSLHNDTINISQETILTTSPGIITEDANYTPFYYFSHLHEYSRQTLATTTVKPDTCEDIMAVDKIIELLKKKLSSDPVLKELILTNNSSTENIYTDSSVAAFISRIYSKKIPSTTTKIPETDYVNSTLLVDLVEAVIFRSDVKMSSDTIEQNTHSIAINPVKIQAELAEVKVNQDFTGHYFFPEDNFEETTVETTDSYYDNTNLPVSDMVLEIEDLRKSSVTKDFLYEILESDSVSEGTTSMHILSPDDVKMYKEGYKVMKKFLKVSGLDYDNISESKFHSIKKRNDRSYLLNINQYRYTTTSSNKYFNKGYYKNNLNSLKFKEKFVTLYKSDKENFIVKYKYLLKRIAADLKELKLNQKFHCARNCSVKCLSSIFLIILSYSTFIQNK